MSGDFYHMSQKAISAAKGQSAVAAAAYRHGAKMDRDLTGDAADFRAKKDCVHAEISMPKDAPGWAHEAYGEGSGLSVAERSARLWNDIEAREQQHNRRATATFAREQIIALPRDLSVGQNVDLVRDYVAREITARGYVANWVIHEKGNNPHVHLMYAERSLEVDGWGNKIRLGNRRQVLVEQREALAEVINVHLERHGFEYRVDHRSYADRGLDIEPTKKVGPEQRGAGAAEAQAEVMARNAKIRAANAEFLKENPAQMLQIVSGQKSEFTREDVWLEAGDRLSFASKDDHDGYVDRALESRDAIVVGVVPWADRLPENVDARVYSSGMRESIRAGVLVRAREMQESRLSVPMPSMVVSELDAMQQLALDEILSDRRLSLVTGFAGAGKTFTMSKAVEALRASGIPVMGGALSGRATEEMAVEGLDSRTLAAWQSYFATSSAHERRPFVFIMDEAGMVGASQMRAIMEAVDARGGKLVLVGDEGQLQPVGEIGLYADMRLQLEGVSIESIRRQRHFLEREASVQLARRNPALALNYYAAHGSVSEVEKLGHAVDQMGSAYWARDDAAGTKGAGEEVSAKPALEGRVLALAHRNSDVGDLNAAIRAAGIEGGHLGDVATYRVHDRLRLEMAVGERLYVHRGISGVGLSKGTFLSVVGLDPRGIYVRADGDEKSVLIEASDLGRVTRGYAVTIHKSQGLTVDHAMVLGSGMMDSHLGYVSLTRHRKGVSLWLSADEIVDQDESEVVPDKGLLSIFTEQIGTAARGFGDPERLAEALREVTVQQANLVHEGQRGHADIHQDGHIAAVVSHYEGLLRSDLKGLKDVTPLGHEMLEDPAQALESLTRVIPAFSVQDLGGHVASHVPDIESYRRVMMEALASDQAVVLGPEDKEVPVRVMTSEAQLGREKVFADAHARLLTSEGQKFSSVASARILSDEQHRAFEAMRAGTHRLQILRGGAGVGKSLVADQLMCAAEASELKSVMVLPDARSRDHAKERHRQMGTKIAESTVVSSVDRAVSADAALYVVDNAHRMKFEDLSKLLDHASQSGADVALVGDERAIGSYERSNSFAHLIDNGTATYTLAGGRGFDAISRDLLDRVYMSEAGAGHGLAKRLAETGQLVGYDGVDAALDGALAAYRADGSQSKIILTQSYAMLEELNATMLKATSEVTRLDVVQKDGEKIALGAGDMVNITGASRGVQVKGGQRAEVLAVTDKRLSLRIEGQGAAEGRVVHVHPCDLYLEYGWGASLRHAPAGIGSVHMLGGVRGDRGVLYSSLTRATENAVLHVPREDADVWVKTAAERVINRNVAIDFLELSPFRSNGREDPQVAKEFARQNLKGQREFNSTQYRSNQRPTTLLREVRRYGGARINWSMSHGLPSLPKNEIDAARLLIRWMAGPSNRPGRRVLERGLSGPVARGMSAGELRADEIARYVEVLYVDAAQIEMKHSREDIRRVLAFGAEQEESVRLLDVRAAVGVEAAADEMRAERFERSVDHQYENDTFINRERWPYTDDPDKNAKRLKIDRPYYDDYVGRLKAHAKAATYSDESRAIDRLVKSAELQSDKLPNDQLKRVLHDLVVMRETGQGPDYKTIMSMREELDNLMHGRVYGQITQQQFKEKVMRLAGSLGWHDAQALKDPKLPLNAPGLEVGPVARKSFSQLLPGNFIGKLLEAPGSRDYDPRLVPEEHKAGVARIRAQQEYERQQEIERSRDMGRGR